MLRIALLVVASLWGSSAWGQAITLAGAPPADPFVNEEFCYDQTLSNTGGDTGFGPYLRLSLPPGINFNSASVDPLGATPTSVAFDGAGNAIDPITNLPVTGPPNGTFVAVVPPIGSLTPGGPIITLNICLQSDDPTAPSDAAVGQAYDIVSQPVFRFGNSPTGSTPIVGPAQTISSTLTVARFTSKVNDFAQTEPPPGYPFNFILTVDIADGQAVTNLDFDDVLPAPLVMANLIGGIPQVAGSAGLTNAGCTITQPAIGSGGTVTVDCPGPVTGTAAGDDVTVSIPVVIPDVLDETMCMDLNVPANTASLLAQYEGSDIFTPAATQSDNSLVAKHFSVQKGAAPATVAPGDTVNYTINYEVSDYAQLTDLVLVDAVPDGLTLDRNSLVLNGNPLVENTDFTVTTQIGANGTEEVITLDFDDLTVGILPLIGDNEVGAGTTGQLTYATTVNQSYVSRFGSTVGTPVPLRINDGLPNTVTSTYAVQGLGGGPPLAGCSEDGAAGITVAGLGLTKTVISSPANGVSYQVGENVVYRLTMTLNAADIVNLQWTDFWPIPIFDAEQYGTTPTVNQPTGSIATTTINYGPAHNLESGGLDVGVGAIVADSGGGAVPSPDAPNSWLITWDEVSEPVAPIVLQLDIAMEIQPAAFADGLSLSNILNVVGDGNQSASSADTGALFIVGAPELNLDKQITGSTNATSNAMISNGDISNADGGDELTYLIALENTGSGSAFDVTATDDAAGGTLQSCAINDDGQPRVVIDNGATPNVIDGTDTRYTNFSGDLFGAGITFDDDGTNAASSANAALAPGTDVNGNNRILIEISCTLPDSVEPGTTITNESGVTWAPGDGSTDRFPEVVDDADANITAVSVNKELVSVSPTEAALGLDGDGNENEVTIGSVVRYRTTVTLPEGTSTDITLRDILDSSLAFVDCTLVNTGSATVTPDNGVALDAGCSNDGNASAATDNPFITNNGGNARDVARQANFDFGTVVVPSTNDAGGADIVIEYEVLVLNVTNANNGNGRNNIAQWRQGNTILDSDSADNVFIREPDVTIGKTFNPASGDSGDVTQVVITIAATGGANRPDAFDVTLSDALPAFLTPITPPTLQACGDSPDVGPTEAMGVITASWDTFTKGSSCQIVFEVQVDAATPIGTNIINTANTDWTSLPGDNTNLSPFIDEFDSERTGSAGIGDGQGGSDDYDAQGSASFMVAPVMATKAVSDRTQTTGNGNFDPSIVDVTIGEVITYDLTVTIPDGSATNVVISDELPIAPTVLEFLSVSAITIGSEITVDNDPPLQTVNDTNADSLNNQLLLDFGNLVNANDTGGTVAADNQITFQVRARVADIPGNAVSGLPVRNNLIVSSDTFTDVTASADVEIAQPNVIVAKSGSATSGEAGDSITYTLDIGHTGISNAAAIDVLLADQLPAELTYQAGTLAAAGAPAGSACTLAPDLLDDSDPNGVGLRIGFDSLPVADVCRFTYQAQINVAAALGDTIMNVADLDYFSTDTNEADEERRSYGDQVEFMVDISGPGLDKQFVSSGDPNTPDSDGFFGPEPDLTIGEEVTYRLVLDLANGTLENAVISDQLPFPGNTPSATFELVSATLSRIGADITIGTGLTVGASPDAISDTAPLDGTNDFFLWNLGDVVNATTDAALPADDQIEFTIVARVRNVPNNPDTDNARNQASLDFDIGGTAQPPLTDSVDMDIVQPLLQIDKTPDTLVEVSGNDTLTFTLAISHTGDSKAVAYDLDITDQLPDPLGSGAPTNFTSSAACQGFVANGGGDPAVVFTITQLDLGDVCTITYDVTVDPTVISGDSYVNNASLQFDSTPGGAGDENGSGDDADTGQFTVDEPSIEKTVFSTNNPDTDQSFGDPFLFDATIGEEVCYHTTVTFPQGVTQQVVVSDTLPSGSANGNEGVLQLTSANVFGSGMLGVTNGFAAVISDELAPAGNDTATFDLGDVTNPTTDNAVTPDDQLVLQVCGVVVNAGPSTPADDDTNESGDVLTNTSRLQFEGPTGTVTDSATADIDMVEPNLGVDKTLAQVDQLVATLQFDITNTGTAPAYELLLDDVLSASNWDLATAIIDTVPAGFVGQVLANTPAAGQTTLQFSSDPAGSLPDTSLEVGETLSFTARVMFADPLPPLPVANVANLSGTSMPDAPDEDRTNTATDTENIGLPELNASKTGTLFDDVDGSGDVTPGDVLSYSIVITNSGTLAATNVVLTDTPDVNSTLIAGTVTTTQGTITDGNAGTPPVEVALGTLAAAGGSASVTYRTTVNNPLPAGINQIVNQGSVSSTEVPDVVTDDPGPVGDDDPTVVPVNSNPIIEASKTDAVFVDADVSGTPSPGDTLRYTVVITNSGNGAASGVTFSDTPDTNTTLVAGSVTTTQGTVTAGNGGMPPIGIDIGTMMGGGAAVTITFDVVVDNPLADGVTEVANQGVVASNELPNEPTDDPDTAPDDDPTVTPLIAEPIIEASKVDTLLIDADFDGVASPGDTLRYTINVVNSGNQDASGVTFVDIPDANTTLVAGSVTTTQGSITGGNAGTPPVTVDIGILAGQGGSVDIAFDVTINSPLPLGVTQIVNQGRVDSNELPSEPTDDPSTGPDDDPNVTPLVGTPIISATKTDSLFSDNDADGIPSPGDELLYTVVLTNSGNQAASGVTFTDTPDSNTTLVAGTVNTTRGTVTGGNAGTPPVTIDVGSVLGGGDSVTISFNVTINNPLPAGITVVANQGLVNSDQTPVTPTDDPDDSDPNDPTDTPVTAVPILEADKADVVLVDADSDGQASPGDTLRYTVNITNSGNIAATGVTFNDTPDSNSQLVVGSVVVAPLGTVVTGNTAGDTTVSVDLDTIPGGGASRSISFDVLIDDPLAAGVTQLSNQGVVGSNEVPDEPTNDPDTPADDDPTNTPLTAAPVLSAIKTDALLVDADSSGSASPGDTLLYTITISNTGSQGVTATFVNDNLDPNVALVVGSVATSRGSVVQGNNPGDTNVEVDSGVIPGNGETAIVTFEVVVDNPLPAGTTVVTNQATISSAELPPIDTDDPDTPPDGDETDTPISTDPLLESFKSDALLTDNDADGIPSPGDVLRYTVLIDNVGNVGLTGLVFNDTPGVNTQLVAGSVVTTLGTVLMGNGGGDTDVSVDIGPLGGGGQVTVTFDVTIDNPLPAGVNQVANQGFVSSDQLPDEPTDDPDLGPEDDPTPTPVTVTPILELDKSVTLLTDADSDGVPSPGDTLSYTLTAINIGNAAATGVVITDTPDANGTFVAGTVITTAGTVTIGNTAGDTSISVDAGTLPGGGASVTVGYQVDIPNPLPAGVSQLVNQAFVSGDGLPAEPSNDLDGPPDDDPTVVPLTSATDLEAFKADSLQVDADSDGIASPGDTLRYTVTLVNSGNSGASGVLFTDIPDANTTLVAGSVASSAGTVTLGNAGGDTQVAVDVGAIPGGGGTVTITFDVTINNPLPAGVTLLTNQGAVDSDQQPTEPTDDPDSPDEDDPTPTPVTSAPVIEATKAVALQTDADANGAVSPGDTLLYTIVVQNVGNGGATGVQYTDIPDSNSTLVNGSVATSAGTVTTGNGAGDSTITIDIGGLGGATSVAISYQTTVNSPLPAGVTELVNQGLVSSNELPTVPTDDPDDAPDGDPTEVSIVAAPDLEVIKTDVLRNDADGNGSPSPGDTLTYIVTVNNDGNQAAISSFANDNLDPNVTLVVGSVITSQGNVTMGNTPGDIDVGVNFGDIAGGNTVTLSFDVTINNPLPAGVTSVTNQAVVFSDNTPVEPSDDPDTPDDDDPTETPVTSNPVIEASKTDVLSLDADNNGVASPGDTLTYIVTISNSGNAAAAGITFSDTPDINTTLVAGSVQTGAGNVTLGNGGADTAVGVSIGTLPGGASVTISFDVTINNPVINNASQVFNQGLVTGPTIPDEPTDDPDSPPDDDPTGTPIDADPILELSKAAINTFDDNTDGLVNSGDRVDYLLTIRNVGNGTANNVTLNDTPDANTLLINGSVVTSVGSVTTGNGAAQTSIAVDVGAIAAGGTVTVAYQVRINDPLPIDVVSIINQAVVTADETGPVDSDDPVTPEGGDPTVVPLDGAELGEIGLAKNVASLLVAAPGFTGSIPSDSALVSYNLRVSNTGVVPLDQVQVIDDMASTFPAPATFEIRSVISFDLTVNNAYDGQTDTNLLAGTDTLAVGEGGLIQLAVLVFPGETMPPYTNTAVATGIGASRTVTDISQDGVDVDPEGDGPGNNSDPTVITFDLRPMPVPTLSTWALLIMMTLLILLARRQLIGKD
ncbi:MAG: beta strand repeat-containing protein [Lysobacterales bacterium]